MKRRMMSLILAVAMIASVAFVPGNAQETDDAITPTDTCPHCGADWDSLEWKEFGYSAEAALEGTGVLSGHYYAADDIKVNSPYTFGVEEGQSQDQAVDVCLDLRGCTIEAAKANSRVLYLYNYSCLTIMDSVGGGQIIGTGKTGTAGKSGGTVYMAKNSRIDLYSGKLVNAQTGREGNGGVVFINSDAQFNMYGGQVDASKTTTTTAAGGAICNYGILNISGGTVLGGSAKNGGALQNAAGAVANISGGMIYGGYAASRGGNINNNGQLNISGGVITGGTTALTGDVRGGNIFSVTSDSELPAVLNISGGIIEEGQTSGYNGNAYGGNVTFTGGSTTISGGIIRGGVAAWAAATITGNPVIENHGYEGMVVYGSYKMTIKDLTEGAKIIIRHYNENSNFSAVTAAADSPDVATYLEEGKLIAASRYSLAVEDGVLGSTLDNTGYCPHCEKEVSWGKYTASTVNSGHYFVGAAGLTLNAEDAALTVATGKDIVLDLNRGMTINAPYTVAGTLTLLSNNVSAAQLISNASNVVNGGVATVTGTLNLYDGLIVGTTVTGNGGALHINGGKLNMYGGRIQGGKATDGGSIYISKGVFNLENGIVIGGEVSNSGGNVFVDGGTFTMKGGIVEGGYASSNGGNVQVNTAGKLNMYGGILLGGEAKNRGGNISNPATNAVTTLYGGTLLDGTANYGGNVYVAHGKLNMYGGTMAYGLGKQYGGNVALYGVFNGDHATCFSMIGDNDITDDAAAPVLFGGDAPKGANVYLDGIATFGACTITGSIEEAVPAFYLGSTAQVTLESTFDNDLILEVGDGKLTELNQERAILNSSCENLQAELYVKNYEMVRLVEDAQHRLALSGAALVLEETGDHTWYLDAQSAANDYAEGSYIKLFTPQTMTLNGDTVVDFNGNTATISGSGTLFGFDSANEDYDGFGSAQITGMEIATSYKRPDGKLYVTLTEDGITSFHRLGIRISNVTLRPSVAGIYYKGLWECDSTLQSKVKSFGVALSTMNMPQADFATDSDTLYTAYGPEQFTSGQAMTSVLVSNILEAGQDNDNRGKQPVFAAPYVVLDDGTEEGLCIVDQDKVSEANGEITSMKAVMGGVNRIWPKLTEAQQAGVKELYAQDSAVMESWGLYNITADVNGTAAIRPLKILTLGHSIAVDSGHMINLVADAEGYNQEFIIGTLYYSGCTLPQHVKFLRANSPEYALYISSSLTPDEPPVRMADYTMYDAIRYEDWDIIIMQGGVFEISQPGTYTNGNIQIIQDYVNQHKTNPDAIFAWHTQWAPPMDPELTALYPYTPNVYVQENAKFDNDRIANYQAILNCVTESIIPDDSFVYFIPNGTAMMNAWTSYLEETDLHRDYIHASDLGRVIAAYTWYCTFAGIDQLEQINLDAIPVAFFKSTTGTEDRVLTDMEKAIILESVNNALANPLQMTQSQYTVAPAE